MSNIGWTDDDRATKLIGDFNIIPIPHDEDSVDGLPAWRWLAFVTWYEPGDERGYWRQECRRHPCPLKLARWVYAKAGDIHRHVREMPGAAT